MKNKVVLIIAFILTTILCSHAEPKENPILERKITISFTDESIQNILDTISKQAGFRFSYSPIALPLSKKISVDFQDETVENVLDYIFENNIKYTVVDNYLVLQKIETPDHKKAEDDPIPREEKHETPLPKDTIKKEDKPDHSIPAKPRETDTGYLPEDIDSNDTLAKGFQLSFFPGVGIDGAQTKHNTYDFSVNVLLGKVQGVNIMEFGGIGNIVEENAGVMQAAGIFNIVGGNYNGIQSAGVFNSVEGTFKGIQISRVFNKAQSFHGFQSTGVFNIVQEDARFVQMSGVSNITGGHFQGIQGAGVFSKANTLQGVQASGVFNLSGKTEGAQIAGVFNVANKTPGLQVASVFNLADSINGTQVAGVFNVADTINGVQIAGVFNKAKFFRGVQIGLINVADSCQGVPLGLVNIIRKGYNKLELSANEMLEVNMAYRGGIKAFHSIISAGIIPEDLDKPFWSVGVGLGSSFRYSDGASLEVEILSKKISKGSYIAYKNNLTSLGTGIDWYINPKLSVYSGITFNMYLANTDCDYYEDHFSKIMPYTFSDSDFNGNKNLKTWLGFKFGVRLF